MAKATYEQAYSDHTYLWTTYGAAADMTGAYVDQEDLALMLRKPNKVTARDCLVRQIEYWFYAGLDETHERNEIDWDDSRLQEIKERYS